MNDTIIHISYPDRVWYETRRDFVTGKAYFASRPATAEDHARRRARIKRFEENRRAGR